LRYQPSLTGLLPFVNRSARAGSGKDSGDGNGHGDKTKNQEPTTSDQLPRPTDFRVAPLPRNPVF